MKAVLSGIVVLVGLAGCAPPDNAVLFDGQRYFGRLQADSEDRRAFTATVSPVSKGLAGAREAARHEGTYYCVTKYGHSYITWTIDPDAPETSFDLSDDRLTVQGRCTE